MPLSIFVDRNLERVQMAQDKDINEIKDAVKPIVGIKESIDKLISQNEEQRIRIQMFLQNEWPSIRDEVDDFDERIRKIENSYSSIENDVDKHSETIKEHEQRIRVVEKFHAQGIVFAVMANVVISILVQVIFKFYGK